MGRSKSATGEASLGSTTRLQAETKSCARTFAPFDHFAFSRISNVYSVPEGLMSQLAATPGCTFPSADSVTNPSYRSRMTSKEKVSTALLGANDAGSPPMPLLRTWLPPVRRSWLEGPPRSHPANTNARAEPTTHIHRRNFGAQFLSIVTLQRESPGGRDRRRSSHLG